MGKIWNTCKKWMGISWVKWAVVPALLALLVLCVEWFGFQGTLLSLPEEQRGERDIPVQKVRVEDLTTEERGYEMTEEEIELARQQDPEDDTEVMYRANVGQGYIHKLVVTMNVATTNSDSETGEDEKKAEGYLPYEIECFYNNEMVDEGVSSTISTWYLFDIDQDYTYIDKTVESLLITTDVAAEVTSIKIDNTVHLNLMRMLCMFVALMAAYLLVLLRKIIGKKLEIGFLIIALSAGFVWVCALPTNTMMTWDDAVHFKMADGLSYGTNEVHWSELEATLTKYGLALSQQSHVMDTVEDQAAFNQMVDAKAKIENEDILYRSWNIADIAYTTQSFGLWLGRVLGLPFHIQFWLGRLGNLLLYVGVCYAAILVSVRYKAAIATIALLPTAMSMACNYSYDPVVLSFSLLGCALFITEMSMPRTLMNWKHAALMLASFCIASFPKAVYIPMILLLLFLPKTKFADRKSHIAFKAGVVLICVIMMSSFVVPTLFAKGGGDTRGGNVNTSEQLSLILSNPIGFAKILVKDVVSSSYSFIINFSQTFVPYLDYMTNDGAVTNFIPLLSLISLGLVFYVLFTDKHEKQGIEPLRESTKWWMLVAIGGIVVLIWTALYLSFTPVGYPHINGVQGRYYIPLFLLAMTVLSPRHIKNQTDPVRYNMMVLGLNGIVLFGFIWIYLISSLWV